MRVSGTGGARVPVVFTLTIVGIAVCAWGFSVVGVRLRDPFGHEVIRSKLALGLSRADVLSRLGEPSCVLERATTPDHYYVDGWAYKEREISNSVLVFLLGEPICYVWIDDDGRVEDYFVGGS